MLEQLVRFVGSVLFDMLLSVVGSLIFRSASLGQVAVDSPFAEGARYGWLGMRRRADGSLALSADAAGYLGLVTVAIATLFIASCLRAG